MKFQEYHKYLLSYVRGGYSQKDPKSLFNIIQHITFSTVVFSSFTDWSGPQYHVAKWFDAFESWNNVHRWFARKAERCTIAQGGGSEERVLV